MRLQFALLLFLIPTIWGKKIFFFFGFSSYSHRVSAWPLVEELAEQKHFVTFLSPHQNKNPNQKVREMVLSSKLSEELGELDMIGNRLKMGKRLVQFVGLFQLPWLGVTICEALLSDPRVQLFINDEKFDLVVVDGLWNDCGFILAKKWGAKIAQFQTGSVLGHYYDGLGFPIESYIPDLIFSSPAGKEITLWGKILANVGYLAIRALKIFYMHPALERQARTYLQMEDIPSIQEIEANTSLVLMNNHFSEEFPRALPPGVIEIGGLHCKEKAGKVPKKILDFIGNSSFVYVSFGTMADITKGPKELAQKFIDAFESEKDLKFIWKWDGDSKSLNLPPNVFTSDWMPQQEILAHPQIVAFITHGGLLGTQEAVFNGVPMIAFPIFAEQDYNSERLQRTKRGFVLDIGSFTAEELIQAIRAVHKDPQYKRNMQNLSVRFKDRPNKPVETAMWWIDYIFRHENSHEYLMPLSIDQYWFQKRLLDVWAVILVLTVIGIYIDYKILCWLFRKCCGSKKSSPKNLPAGKKRN